MPDRRRQRQQRVRHDAGGAQNPVGASNRDAEPEKATATKPQRQGGAGVAYAEPKQYESVTIMPDKEPPPEPEKYHRREVISNWLRYEDIPTDEPEEGEDYLLGEDFSQILEQQALGSPGGHMRLKGESLWDESENNILTSHGLGALHVADLVASINTVPLYLQLNIPEESLPESVVDFYTQVAEDNRKLYQPSTNNYNDCNDINEKLIQSLKISDNEPLNLTSEVPEAEQTTKNAVDVALSLTEAFAPEPEDVDLDTLVHEPSPVRQPSPEKQPIVNRQPSPVKQQSPVRQPSPIKQQQQQPVAMQQTTSVRQPSPVKEPSPLKETPKQPVPQREKSKEKSPASFDFGLPKKVGKETSASGGFNFGLPKADISTANPKLSKLTGNLKDNVDVTSLLRTEEKKEEEPEGPAVDLDAPIEENKPVQLVSKTEAEDLEDWLDSMLDD